MLSLRYTCSNGGIDILRINDFTRSYFLSVPRSYYSLTQYRSKRKNGTERKYDRVTREKIMAYYIGLGQEKDGGRACYPAHSKLEMRQVMRKAARRGDKIEWWYAQTRTGCNILKVADIGDWTPTPRCVTDIQVIPCPKCGHLPEDEQGCSICNWSGITTRERLRGYADWQLKPEKSRHFGVTTKKTPISPKTDIAALNRKPLEVC